MKPYSTSHHTSTIQNYTQCYYSVQNNITSARKMHFGHSFIGSYVIVVCSTILCLIYGYYKHCHGYWDRKKVENEPGKFPFGSITSVLLRKQSFTDRIGEIYTKFKQKGCKYAGLYFFNRKALLIIDPELVKKVLTTDFQYFPDRGIYHDEKNDPLSAHLVALSGEEWRELRHKVTPTFSSGKLKGMFPTILATAERLTDALRDTKTVEMKDLAARYTTDVIGSCAFGIECNSLANPDAEFRRAGRRVFQSNFFDGIKRIVIRNAPRLARILRIKVINPAVSSFFLGVVKETIDHRREKGITRKDFLQLLMELMDKGAAAADNETKEKEKFTLTMSQVAAHAFVFFLAGFETSASTITFALYELARYQDVQNKLRKEIQEIVNKYQGITYDAMQDMNYMEQVLLETMRRYPTFVILMRKCTTNYLLPGDILLEKGTPVIIPVHALHHDAEFYPSPDLFSPERFHNETQFKSDHTYLPFGNGPRICIGLRFAMIQMKIAISILLLKYKFTLKSEEPLVMDPRSFVLSPLGGTWLNVEELTEK